jgi:hypothetical protein
MDGEDVSRETSLRSVCGEIVHPVRGKISPLRRAENEKKEIGWERFFR